MSCILSRTMKHMRTSLVVVVFSSAIAVQGVAARFVPLGDLPGGDFYSYAYGVSADGLVVVGTSESDHGREAFFWTADAGMVGLGSLPGDRFGSHAEAVSADGSVVIGTSNDEAFRWTAYEGMIGLGYLAGSNSSVATDVSADGLVIVGSSGSPGEAFRWTADEGIIGLGHLEGLADEPYSWASAVSADGRTIVGESTGGLEDIYLDAFRWTSDDGMVGLGFVESLPFEGFSSFPARGVSDDGSVIIGNARIEAQLPNGKSWIWQSTGEMQNLADAHNWSQQLSPNLSFDLSANGEIVVGQAFFLGGWISDSSDGQRFIQEVLVESGLDLDGWSLFTATGISADGRIVVGTGTNPSGQVEAWLADLSVPEPSTLRCALISMLAGCGCWVRRRFA